MTDRRAQSKNPQDDEAELTEEHASGAPDPSETTGDTQGGEDQGRRRQTRL
ncbi:MAG TPA: hypothetical protein VGP70_14935 [Actinomadura sp.]|jgi:hypothetical protein|nr:hypothetical protein [Actinomadura sp.]